MSLFDSFVKMLHELCTHLEFVTALLTCKLLIYLNAEFCLII